MPYSKARPSIHTNEKSALPIIHIHGRLDEMAPASNIDCSRNHINSKFLKMVDIEDTNHFISWTDYELVIRELLLLLESEEVMKVR